MIRGLQLTTVVKNVVLVPQILQKIDCGAESVTVVSFAYTKKHAAFWQRAMTLGAPDWRRRLNLIESQPAGALTAPGFLAHTKPQENVAAVPARALETLADAYPRASHFFLVDVVAL